MEAELFELRILLSCLCEEVRGLRGDLNKRKSGRLEQSDSQADLKVGDDAEDLF